jgi:hypothetical protein
MERQIFRSGVPAIVKRYELTTTQWARLEPLLPGKASDPGRTAADKGCLPRVIDDPDIFRAAKLLIDQQGEDAAVHAAQRVDGLAAAGDLGGSVAWCRILEAIGRECAAGSYLTTE